MAKNILRSAIRGTSDTFYDNYMYNQTVNNRVNDDDDEEEFDLDGDVWGWIEKMKQTFDAIRRRFNYNDDNSDEYEFDEYDEYEYDLLYWSMGNEYKEWRNNISKTFKEIRKLRIDIPEDIINYDDDSDDEDYSDDEDDNEIYYESYDGDDEYVLVNE